MSGPSVNGLGSVGSGQSISDPSKINAALVRRGSGNDISIDKEAYNSLRSQDVSHETIVEAIKSLNPSKDFDAISSSLNEVHVDFEISKIASNLVKNAISSAIASIQSKAQEMFSKDMDQEPPLFKAFRTKDPNPMQSKNKIVALNKKFESLSIEISKVNKIQNELSEELGKVNTANRPRINLLIKQIQPQQAKLDKALTFFRGLNITENDLKTLSVEQVLSKISPDNLPKAKVEYRNYLDSSKKYVEMNQTLNQLSEPIRHFESEKSRFNEIGAKISQEMSSIQEQIISLKNYDHVSDNPNALSVDQNSFKISTAGQTPMLKTIGLGPCVCITLWNPTTKTGLLAHIDSSVDGDPKSAIERLKGEFIKGLPNQEIEVNIIGGNTTASSNPVKSSENIISAIKQVFPSSKVDERNVLGGDTRDVIFSLETGEAAIIDKHTLITEPIKASEQTRII